MKKANKIRVPKSGINKLVHKQIRDLIKLGWTWDEVVKALGVSKTTISLATKGRLKG